MYNKITVWGGENHTICLSDNSSVYYFGENDISFISNHSEYYPILLPFSCNILLISCDYYHSMFLDDNGCLWSHGKCFYGALGLGKNIQQVRTPSKIYFNNKIINVTCGTHHVLFIDQNYDLWSFGYNSHGQLGDYGKSKNKPTQTSLSNIVSMSAGYHSICKSNDGIFYGFGSNKYGELGINNEYKNVYIPTVLTNFPSNIISYSSGANHTVLLNDNRDIYTFGCNEDGQLGIPKTEILQTASPCLVRLNDVKIKIITCGYRDSRCLDINGNLWLFGSLSCGIEKTNLRNIEMVSNGGDHILVKDNNNIIWAKGNKKGQLGIGDNNSQKIFLKLEDQYCDIISIPIIPKGKSARK